MRPRCASPSRADRPRPFLLLLTPSPHPKQPRSASPFSEGGALFALGIIHANHSSDIRTYLLDALRNAGTNEVVQHGACLGLGIAAMGTEDDELYEELKASRYRPHYQPQPPPPAAPPAPPSWLAVHPPLSPSA